MLTERQDASDRRQNNVKRQQSAFLSLECRRRIVGVLEDLFQSVKKEHGREIRKTRRAKMKMNKQQARRCENELSSDAAAAASPANGPAPSQPTEKASVGSTIARAAGKYGGYTQELLCYIPQLVYCMRFSLPLTRSPLANFLIRVAIEGGPVLRNQIYWTLQQKVVWKPVTRDA